MRKTIKFINGQAEVVVNNPTDHIQKAWMAGNFYESQRNGLLGYIYAKCQGIKTVLDVGASIGNHTLFFLHEMGCDFVYAVEPFPDSIEHLKQNIALNKAKTKTKVIESVAWNAKALGTMAIPEGAGNVGMAEFTQDKKGTIKADTLDNLTGTKRRKIDFMKIDTEHTEVQVLQGAHHILADDRPIVSVETQDFETVAEIMKQYGYKPDMAGSKPVSVNHTPTYIFWPG